MKAKHPGVLAALALPLVGLLLLTAWKQARVIIGTRVVVPIAGYDPRDLLSGHYLTYRLDLDSHAACPANEGDSDADANAETPERTRLLCLNTDANDRLEVRALATYEFDPPATPDGCTVVLRGTCHFGRFSANVERFYVPEKDAPRLDGAVRSRRGDIVLRVDRFGGAVVEELLLDGHPWREAIDKTSD